MNNRFVFVMPAYNASETVARSILSVWFQTYPNWKILIRDDVSTDNTLEIVKQLKKDLGCSDDKIQIKRNDEKNWEVKNILEMLEETDSNDIICRLDADDWLCDCDALTIIDSCYRQLEVEALWTSHRWSFNSHNISAALPKEADPYTHPWVSSHLKTFRKKLIENVNDENFRNEDGEYFKRIGDQAIYLPVLNNAAGNWYHLPITAYHYSINLEPETFKTVDAKFQKQEAEFLRKRGYVK
jgi:glycosyltransferase involved in cell wall biosynthesis